MCDVKIFLTFTSPNMVLLWQLFYPFCSCILILLQWQPEPLNRNESGRFGALKSDSTHHFFRNACTKSVITIFTVFRLLTDFVCLYTYEFLLSLCCIVRSSVILLLPLFITRRFLLNIKMSMQLSIYNSREEIKSHRSLNVDNLNVKIQIQQEFKILRYVPLVVTETNWILKWRHFYIYIVFS